MVPFTDGRHHHSTCLTLSYSRHHHTSTRLTLSHSRHHHTSTRLTLSNSRHHDTSTRLTLSYSPCGTSMEYGVPPTTLSFQQAFLVLACRSIDMIFLLPVP